MKLDSLKVKQAVGAGASSYPPRMMLSLLIYCYSMGFVWEPADRACNAPGRGGSFPDRRHSSRSMTRSARFGGTILTLWPQTFLGSAEAGQRDGGAEGWGRLSVDGNATSWRMRRSTSQWGMETCGATRRATQKRPFAQLLEKANQADAQNHGRRAEAARVDSRVREKAAGENAEGPADAWRSRRRRSPRRSVRRMREEDGGAEGAEGTTTIRPRTVRLVRPSKARAGGEGVESI